MPLSETTRETANRLIARYPQPRSAMLPLLWLVQAEQGYITAEGIAFCADLLDLTRAEVQAVQTYYERFEREPVGDWLLTICVNFSCKIRGGVEILRRLLVENGGEIDHERGIAVKHAECLGNCEDAPVVQINYQNYKKCSLEQSLELLEACRRGDPPPATDGQSPATFREVCWRLSGAADGAVIHAAAVHGAEVDVRSFEEPPAQRILDAEIPLGTRGVRAPGTQVGDTAGVPDISEVTGRPPEQQPPAGERLDRPARQTEEGGTPGDEPEHDEQGEESAGKEAAEPAEEELAATDPFPPGPPPPPEEEEPSPYPGGEAGAWEGER